MTTSLPSLARFCNCCRACSWNASSSSAAAYSGPLSANTARVILSCPSDKGRDSHSHRCVAAPYRRDLQRTVCPQKPAFPQVLSQGRLDHRRQRGRSLLGPYVLIHGLCKVIGKGHCGTLHRSIISLLAPCGENGEVGVIGEY